VGAKKRKNARTSLDKDFGPGHTESKMQLSVNCALPETFPANVSASLPASLATSLPTSLQTNLVDLRRGDAAILDAIDLPVDDARRLMELGFLPGTQITAGRSAPGGDPRVFQVDGSEIALRRETARHLTVRRTPAKLDSTPRA